MNDQAVVSATHFAPPERSSAEKIRARSQKLQDDPNISHLLDSFPEPAVVIDGSRQVILANDKIARLLGTSREALLGRRPGEAFSCVHADEEPAGCGTSAFCRYCGAVDGILACMQDGEATVRECRLTRKGGDGTVSLDLRVWTTAVDVEGEIYYVFAVRDTTDEKRRLVLEKLFFHDVLNSAGGLMGLLEILDLSTPKEAAELQGDARRLASHLVEEIKAQKDLAAAERGELAVDPVPVAVAPFLTDICAFYRYNPVAEERKIRLEPVDGDPAIETDPVLLRRVIGNLVKNALEASAVEQTVTVRYANDSGHLFTVHNESVMSDDVKHQVFQRSFSTKASSGRGLGTYSIKLLTENYLNGWVTFESMVGAGTTFYVRLP